MEITDNQANPFDGPGLVRRAVADTKKPALRLACLVDYYDILIELSGRYPHTKHRFTRTPRSILICVDIDLLGYDSFVGIENNSYLCRSN